MCPTLEGGFLTTGTPRKSLLFCFLSDRLGSVEVSNFDEVHYISLTVVFFVCLQDQKEFLFSRRSFTVLAFILRSDSS